VPEVLDPAESLVAITVGNTKEGTLFPANLILYTQFHYP